MIAGKATYKELEQRVKVLEDKAAQAKLEVGTFKNSQIELAAILANTPLLMMLVDQDRRVKKVNDAVLQFTGQKEEGILGLRGGEALRCVHHLDDPEGCGFGTTCNTCTVRNAVLDTFKNRNRLHNIEANLSFIDDKVKERTLLVSTVFLEIPDERVLVFVQDITARKRVEESLRMEKDKAQNYLDIAGVVIVVINTDETVALINKKGCEVLGYKEEEVIGKNWFDNFLPETDREQARVILSELIFGNIESVKYFENPILTKNNEERIIAWHNSVFRDKEGNIITTLSSGEDITDRRKTEEALRESEERFKNLANLLPLPVWEMNLEGNFTYANRVGYENFGYTPQNLEKGVSVANIIAPEDRERVVSNLGKTLRGIEFENHEYTCLTKDGRKFPALIYSSPIIKDGEPFGVRGATLDITERKRAEEELQKARDDLEQRVKERTAELAESNEELKKEIIEHKKTEGALRESENRTRNLVESSPVGISIIQQNQIVYQNPSLKRLWGPLSKRFENHVLDYLHPDDVEKCKEVYLQMTSGKTPTAEVDFRFYPPGEKDHKFSLCWVRCNAILINYQGEDAILLNMMDITRVKEIEHLLTIKQKMSSLGHVAAGIAHEIRNPLTGINSYLYTLEDLCDSEIIEGDQIEMIKQIISQFQLASDKIEAVIKRALDFSRPNPPKMDLIDLNQCIEGTLNLSAVTLRKNNIKLEKSLEPDLPQCYGDSHLIEQVLLNLVNNAARAMEKNQKAKRIQIDSFRKKTSLYIQVSDSGPGIPKELKDQIYNPFFTTSPDGTGIGLSIAQRIISDHHGAIAILENKYGGATFRVELPIEKRTPSR